MAALLLSSCAGVEIKDFEECSPLPNGLGASCAWFLSPATSFDTEAEWVAQQEAWNNQGQAVECTTSQSFADIKAEVEQLCSVTICNEQTQGAVAKIVAGLNRFSKLGDKHVDKTSHE